MRDDAEADIGQVKLLTPFVNDLLLFEPPMLDRQAFSRTGARLSCQGAEFPSKITAYLPNQSDNSFQATYFQIIWSATLE